MLTSGEQRQVWTRALRDEARALRRPLRDDALEIVMCGAENEDKLPA
jgi:hypothetical protein